MFSAISLNWRDQGGLKISCDFYKNTYDIGKGAKISPEEGLNSE